MRFLKLHKSLSDKTIEDHLRVMESFLNNGIPMDDFMLQVTENKSVSTYKNCLSTLKVVQIPVVVKIITITS